MNNGAHNARATTLRPIVLTHRDPSDEAGALALGAYKKDTNFLRCLQQPAPATRVLLVAIGVVFALGYLLSAFVIEPRYGEVGESPIFPMVVFGAKINQQIEGGAWWRLISHTFLHGGLLHLLFNGYALFMLGTIVERLMGTRRFIVIYGVAGLAGALSSFAFNDMASVGASGAIYGVFGAVIVFGFKQRSVLPGNVARTLSTGLLPWLLLSLAFGLLPMVDNAAHFGGMLGGTLVAMGMSTPLRGATSRWADGLMGVLVVVLAVAAVGSLLAGAAFGWSCLSSAEAWEACRAIDLASP